MKHFYIIPIFFSSLSLISGQSSDDSLKSHLLLTLEIDAKRIVGDISRLEPVKNTYIYSGKKNEVIYLNQANISLPEKHGRQIFAKIPGIFVYDMDGTGNQMNISTRGLDAHRGWEFNIRKDGIITNTDMYGYPASHYNIPIEAVEKIELVRGTAAQQYGGQFGGMLNYVTKKPDSRKIGFESINTAGSFGLVSTYNAISGTLGKFRYSAWFNKKHNKGYRQNGDSDFNAEGISLFYDFSDDLTIKLDYTHSNYVIHLAGPLTGQQFNEDPRQSTRSRNYYNPNIHVPSITLDWKISERTILKLNSSAILGERNSVMFDKPATVADSINHQTLTQNNRQVDIDFYNSYTSELRIMHHYNWFKRNHTITAGIQSFNNNLIRKQQGKGSTGSDFDLTLVQDGWGRDLKFNTNNVAAFIENKFMLAHRLSLNLAGRMEVGQSKLSGQIINYPEASLPNIIKHKFPTFGLSAQYDLNHGNIYAGWSQAYRPVILKDIVPSSVYESSDKNLKDAHGYNLEIGYRGQSDRFMWDMTAYYLLYKNRLGTIALADASQNLVIFKTNIGDSHSKGLECFLQYQILNTKNHSLNVYTSTSLLDARYKNATLRNSKNENITVDGNKVESAPSVISRNGISYYVGKFNLQALYSYTAASFADAFNAVTEDVNGATGLVPAYSLFDVIAGYKFSQNLRISGSINNLFNTSYFTKRPQFYPGPGIWPSDGRSYSISMHIVL